MPTSHPMVETCTAHVGDFPKDIVIDMAAQPREAGFRALWSRSWCAWIRDSLVLAYFLSGSPLYDQRLAISPGVSLNQILAVSCLAMVALSIPFRSCSAPKTWATVGLVTVLTVLLAIRSVGSPSPEYARFKVLGHLLLILPVLLYVQLNTRRPEEVIRYIKIYCFAASTMLLLSIPHMLSLQEGQRLAILAGGPNVFARIIGTGALSSILLFNLCSSKRRRRWIYLVGLPLAATAIILAGTKAVLAGMMLAVMAMFSTGNLRQRSLRIALLLLALSALPLLTHSRVRNLPKDGGIVRLLRLPDWDDPEGSFGSRLRYLGGSLEIIREAPWFGVGTGAWGPRSGLGNSESYPHNILVEILTELGLVGLVLVCLPMVRFPRGDARAGVEARVLRFGLLGLVVFWLVNVQLSGDLVDSRSLWFFVLLFEIGSLGDRTPAKASGAAGHATRGS